MSSLDHDTFTLAGGLVATPGGLREAHVVVAGGKIAGIEPGLREGEIVDVHGAWVGPGFVDVHTHLREPGQEWKEDVGTGSQAAAAGGYTAVVAMPNTVPAMDSAATLGLVAARGREVGLVEVQPAGTITLAREGKRPAPFEELWEAGARLFTDDGDWVVDDAVMEEAMERVGRLGGVVVSHAEDPRLSAGGHVNAGTAAAALGVGPIPAESEERALARDLELARTTGTRYHAQHVSTAGAVALLRTARNAGLAVTGEATPHHLSFDDGAVAGGDPSFKMKPPLRSAADVAAIRAALQEGVLEMVGTDHAPHSREEKSAGFEAAPFGVLGLETAAPAVYTAVRLDPEAFFDRMSVAPARLAGFRGHGRLPVVGGDANLVVFHPGVEWTPTVLRSRSSNCPFLGRTLRGRVLVTVYRGRITYRGEGS